MDYSTIHCRFCDKNIIDLRRYEMHLKKVHHKDPNLTVEVGKDIENIQKSGYKMFKCDQCQKNYATKYYLEKHKETSCKGGIIVPTSEDAVYALIDKLDTDARKRVESKLIQQYGFFSVNNNQTVNNEDHSAYCTGNNNDISVTDNSVHFNIIINPIGKEQVEDVKEVLLNSQDLLRKITEDCGEKNGKFLAEGSEKYIEELFLKVFQHIHFNEDNPENHNLNITNVKKYVPYHVYKDDGWERSGDMTLLRQEFVRMKSIIAESLEHTNKKDKEKIMRTINNYEDRNRKGGLYSESKLSKMMSHKMHNLGYNNRGIVKETYEKTKNLIE